jgi:hypothetical protein
MTTLTIEISNEELALFKAILPKFKAKIVHQDHGQDFWENLNQQQKEDILAGIEEIDKGDTSDYETVMKKHR